MIQKVDGFWGLFRKQPIWFILVISLVIGPFFNGYAHIILTGTVNLPFFFDSVATAVIAAVFGPAAGVLTGIATNWVIELFQGFPLTTYPFGICGAMTGLIVGIFAKRKKFSTIPLFLLVTAIVTIANSVSGAIISIFAYGGLAEDYLSFIVTGFITAGRSLFSAAFLARIPVNLIDKGIAVAIAFVVYNRIYLQQPLCPSRIRYKGKPGKFSGLK